MNGVPGRQAGYCGSKANKEKDRITNILHINVAPIHESALFICDILFKSYKIFSPSADNSPSHHINPVECRMSNIEYRM